MALFVPGTPCRLCGREMLRGDEVVTFAPFVANKKNPLFIFSDGAVHKSCFERHPLAERARCCHGEALAMLAPDKRLCIVCGERIRKPEEYFTIGFLTDDPASPLFQYNYLQAHRAHLASWSGYTELRRLVEQFQSSGEWDGPRVAFP